MRVKFLKDVSTHCIKCKGPVHTAKVGTIGEVTKAIIKGDSSGTKITDLSNYSDLNSFAMIWVDVNNPSGCCIKLCADCAIKDKCIELV